MKLHLDREFLSTGAGIALLIAAPIAPLLAGPEGGWPYGAYAQASRPGASLLQPASFAPAPVSARPAASLAARAPAPSPACETACASRIETNVIEQPASAAVDPVEDPALVDRGQSDIAELLKAIAASAAADAEQTVRYGDAQVRLPQPGFGRAVRMSQAQTLREIDNRGTPAGRSRTLAPRGPFQVDDPDRLAGGSGWSVEHLIAPVNYPI